MPYSCIRARFAAGFASLASPPSASKQKKATKPSPILNASRLPPDQVRGYGAQACGHSSPIRRAAMKAWWGIETLPHSRILFFPMSASVSPPDWPSGAIPLLQQLVHCARTAPHAIRARELRSVMPPAWQCSLLR